MQSIKKCKKCGDLIWSSYRHDMVWCKCGAIAIDGGEDYCRLTGNLDDMETIEPIDALNFLKDANTRLLTEIDNANERLEAKESVNRIYQNTLSLKSDDFKELVAEVIELKKQLAAKDEQIKTRVDAYEKTFIEQSDEIYRLRLQLTEKEKEIDTVKMALNDACRDYGGTLSEITPNKIGFAIAELEKVKEFIEYRRKIESNPYDAHFFCEYLDAGAMRMKINQQIKELNKKNNESI